MNTVIVCFIVRLQFNDPFLTRVTIQDLKKKEKDLQARETDLKRREEVGLPSTLYSFVAWTLL